MIFNDIVEVLYAPKRAFKRIIENPKYLGALIILLLFIGVEIGFEYVQFSRTYSENTSPAINQLPMYSNATLWRTSSDVALSNNYNDFFNYSVYVAAFSVPPSDPQGYYSLFGNSSLAINANNTKSVSAALGNVFNLNCNTGGFQNISTTIKLVSPQTTPQNADLVLYSLSDSNFYTYNLTSLLSNNTAISLWQNLTIPVGPNAQGWSSSGTPTWSNVTSLKLDFNYATPSNVTIHIGALFFRGQYETPIQLGITDFLIGFLERFSLQFLFSWFLLTALIYIFFKGFKANVVWKPLFIAVVFALFVMVIRALINLGGALTLPNVYYPFDVSPGATINVFGAISYPANAAGVLSMMSQSAVSIINSATSSIVFVTLAAFAIGYVWLGAVCTVIVGTLNPVFSMTKRIIISAVSVGVTILLLLLLVTIA